MDKDIVIVSYKDSIDTEYALLDAFSRNADNKMGFIKEVKELDIDYVETRVSPTLNLRWVKKYSND